MASNISHDELLDLKPISGETIGGTLVETSGGILGEISGETIGGTLVETSGGILGGTLVETSGGILGGTSGVTLGGTSVGTSGGTSGGTSSVTLGGTSVGTSVGTSSVTSSGTSGVTSIGTSVGTSGVTSVGTSGVTSINTQDNFDKIRLTSYDVILNVKKTTRLDNENSNNHNQYTNILQTYSNSLPISDITNTKVYGITNLHTVPTIDLDFDIENSSLFKASYLNQTVQKIKNEIVIGSINNAEINLKRSDINIFKSLLATNIISVTYQIVSDDPIILQNMLRYNFYEYNPNIQNETYYYFKNISNSNELWKHTNGTVNTTDSAVLGNDINITGTSGIYHFNNGYIIDLEWGLTTQKYYRKIITQSQSVGLNYLYKKDNDMFIFTATNNVNNQNNNTFIKVSQIISKSQINLPIIAISNNNKVYEISTNGIVTNPININNSYKYLVNNIFKLYKVNSSSILIQYDINDYIYDTNPESSTFHKVIHNVSTNLGFDYVKNGFWKIDNDIVVDNVNVLANTKLYNFIKGSIDYSYFSNVNLVNNTGILYFADEDRFSPNTNLNNSPIIMTFTLPLDTETRYGILNKAITISDEMAITTEYYISSTSYIRRVSNNSEPSIFDGVYIIKNINTNISKCYSINISGQVTLYNGIVYDNSNFYSYVLNGVSSPLNTGLYVDNVGKVISVNSGVWTNIILNQNLLNYIQINIANQDFIIRKLINNNNSIQLDNISDNYTNSNALIKYNNKLYKINKFKEPVVLELGSYSQLKSKVYLSNTITGILNIINDGLYFWLIDNYPKIFQIKSGIIIWIKSNGFDFFNLQTILYPLFIELLPNNIFGRLFKYDNINGSCKNIPEGKYYLPNYNTNNNLFNILDYRLCSSALENQYINIYYNITSVNNSPVNNTILISFQSGTSKTYILKNGISFSDVTFELLYIVRPDNSLEYWNNNSSIIETVGEKIFNTYYIGYDGKLSKSGSKNNNRVEIIKNNQWVVYSDNTKDIFIDGVKIDPEIGTIISINTLKTQGENIENGLIIYRQIATDINNWDRIITEATISMSNIRPPRFTIVSNNTTQQTALLNPKNGDVVFISEFPTSGLFSNSLINLKDLYMLINESNPNIFSSWVKFN